MTTEISREVQLSNEPIDLPGRFPFPYQPEIFTPEEEEVLSRFFTNINGPVFAIKNLPQQVVGAMLSRYSRSIESVRRLFLDEFWSTPELGISHVTEYLVAEEGGGLEAMRERAERFYRSVFAEFGDDSVIQMGSVHIAFEGVSQIAAKAIEDQRIGAAYMEKSTRYVDFGTEDGHFLFMEEPEIMASEYAQEYLDWNEASFHLYNHCTRVMEDHLREKYPIEEQEFENPKTGAKARFDQIDDENVRRRAERAYERALKAKTFDTVRVFLPTTTVTNLGAHYSGQAAEHAINKMIASPYSEVRLIGAMALQEVSKVVPSFMENVDHPYGVTTRQYFRDVRELHIEIASQYVDAITETQQKDGDKLVGWDKDTDIKLAGQILYTGQRANISKTTIVEELRKTKEEERERWSSTLAEIITSAIPDRRSKGLNRRHKLPRAFEHAFAEVEFDLPFEIYRDLQRNRMSSTERQSLTAREHYIPPEFEEKGMEQILVDYLTHMSQTRDLNRKVSEFSPTAAEYVTLFGNKVRFNIKANIRQWVFFAELRTVSGGHPGYRRALQSAARQIIDKMPFLEPLFAHVDWKEDYGLGRLTAEVKTQEKLEELADTRN